MDRFIDLSCLEHPHVLIDPVYAFERNFTKKPLDGYLLPTLWTWESIADKLIKIAENLFHTHGLCLIIKDAYRPVRSSASMVAWAEEQGLVTALVPKFIGPAGKSQHNNGSAIDMTLATSDGREIWMGSIFDEFNEYAGFSNGRKIHDIDHMWAKDGHYEVSDFPLEKLRTIIRNEAGKVGLLPYEEEWWHFFDPTIHHTVIDIDIDSYNPSVV